MGRRLAPVALLALAVLPAACGNERQRPDKVPPPAAPTGRQAQSFPDYGVAFRRPSNWLVTVGDLPQLGAVSSGRATVVLWRYKRRERLPRTTTELRRAARALLAAVRVRDRSFDVDAAGPLRVAGFPAVQVVGTQRVRGQRRRVRSTHVYAHGAELVLDAYSPPADFTRVDRTVFRPLVASLRLRSPRS